MNNLKLSGSIPQTKWDPVNSMWVSALRPVGVNGSEAADGTTSTWSVARFAVGGHYICLAVLWGAAGTI